MARCWYAHAKQPTGIFAGYSTSKNFVYGWCFVVAYCSWISQLYPHSPKPSAKETNWKITKWINQESTNDWDITATKHNSGVHYAPKNMHTALFCFGLLCGRIMISYWIMRRVFIHILESYFPGTGSAVWYPQCPRSMARYMGELTYIKSQPSTPKRARNMFILLVCTICAGLTFDMLSSLYSSNAPNMHRKEYEINNQDWYL